MMIPLLVRHGTLYVMWSCASSAPFVELDRAEYLNELDFGAWRIHVKIDWRPKGWDEGAHQKWIAGRGVTS